MLEFEVCEDVSEELARGKRIWNSAWLDSQKKPGQVRSRLVVHQVRGACKREDVFAGTPPLAAMRFVLSRAASRGHGRCIGLWDVSTTFFHATIEEEVCVRPPTNMRKDKTIWKLLKAVEDPHECAVCWIQRDRRPDGGVSWRRFYGRGSRQSVGQIWMQCGIHSRSNGYHVLVQQPVMKVCFCRERDG